MYKVKILHRGSEEGLVQITLEDTGDVGELAFILEKYLNNKYAGGPAYKDPQNLLKTLRYVQQRNCA